MGFAVKSCFLCELMGNLQLTLRAWIHTEDSKRRTLQRNDIAMAITKFDQVIEEKPDIQRIIIR